MIVHATTADLAAAPWSVTPANAAVLLRVASRLIDGALLTAIYTTDTTGKATDERVLSVLREATCAQAAAWAAHGIDPATGTPTQVSTGVVKAKSLATASFDYDTTEATLTAQQRVAAGRELSPEAWQILSASGLLSGRVWVSG